MMNTPAKAKRDYFNATCIECGSRFYTNTGVARKCVNCIRKEKSMRSDQCDVCGSPCKSTDFVCSDKCANAYWKKHK